MVARWSNTVDGDELEVFIEVNLVDPAALLAPGADWNEDSKDHEEVDDREDDLLLFGRLHVG